METLSPNRITHFRENGVDKVYIQLQDKNESSTVSVGSSGYTFYNEQFHWIGIEFAFGGTNSSVLFDPSSTPAFKEKAEFSVESNENGIYGIECINGIISGISRSHPFIQ